MTYEPSQIAELIAALPLPVMVIGADQRVHALNAQATAIFGHGAVGRHFTTTLRQPKLVTAVEQSLEDFGARDVTYQVVEFGAEAIYDVHVAGVGDAGLLMISFQNATALAQADQMRRDFVANVSHELRTPLTALMGFVETLRGPAKDDAAARDRFLAIMAREADRMNRLVGGLLSLSRVEADERVRPTDLIDLRDLLGAAVQNLTVVAKGQGVELAYVAGKSPHNVVGEGDQLLQVFTNLIENAIKYGGPQKSVRIDVAMTDHDAALRGPAFEVTVADQGAGIAPLHLPRLTERFYRVDSHRSRELGGTGLGLAIVKHILNRHRGRLKVTSQLGEGSQFTVILPRNA